MTGIVLVRPWRNAAAGGGCCSAGPDSVGLDCTRHEGQPAGDVFSETYRLLRERIPGVDVQIVASSNTLFLLPIAYGAARRAGNGHGHAVRQALQSTTAGAVLIDGAVAGDVESMGPNGVLGKVRNSAIDTLSEGR